MKDSKGKGKEESNPQMTMSRNQPHSISSSDTREQILQHHQDQVARNESLHLSPLEFTQQLFHLRNNPPSPWLQRPLKPPKPQPPHKPALPPKPQGMDNQLDRVLPLPVTPPITSSTSSTSPYIACLRRVVVVVVETHYFMSSGRRRWT